MIDSNRPAYQNGAHGTGVSRAVMAAFVVVAISFICSAAASAASWELNKNFGPEKPVTPPAFTEETQMGGVVGLAINRTGAGGVEPGTIYSAGVSPEGWHAARFSPEGAFELSWGEVPSGRCGPKVLNGPSCRPQNTGASSTVSVAVDQTTGDVYLFRESAVPNILQIYEPDGQGPIAEFGGTVDSQGTVATTPERLHQALGTQFIAVNDAGDLYLSDDEVSVKRLMTFEPTIPGDLATYAYAGRAKDVGTTTGEGAPLNPVLDDAGNLYVQSENLVQEYDPSKPATPVCSSRFKPGGITSLTVNPKTGAPFFYTSKERLVHQLSPCNGSGEFVEKEPDGSYAAGPPFAALPQRGNLTAMAFDPDRQIESPAEKELEEKEENEGITPESARYLPGVLVGGAALECPGLGECPAEALKSQTGLGYIFAPLRKAAPSVLSESVTNVGQSSATLSAEINPRSSETTYSFQYIPASVYESNDPAEPFAGAGSAPVNVALLPQSRLALATVSGLAAGTEFRYRVVATNATGTTSGPAEHFRTYPAEVQGGVEGREFELVSPVQKNGGEVLPADPSLSREAGCGAVCKPGGAANDAKRYPIQVGANGDSIAYQGQPFEAAAGTTEFDQYVSTRTPEGWRTVGESAPLEVGVGGPQFRAYALNEDLTNALTFSTNWSHAPSAPFGYLNIFDRPVDDSLAVEPLITTQPPNRNPGSGTNSFALRYVGATQDLSRVFFEANDALTGQTNVAPASVAGTEKQFNLYEWHAGEIRLVNVGPSSTTGPGAEFGSGFLLSQEPSARQDFSHAISEDGSRVFWSSMSGQVYVRERGEVTREIPDHAGKYLTASADGSKVLLSDGTLFNLVSNVSTDLTEGKGVFDGISGQSEDLSHIYFVLGPATGEGTLTVGAGARKVTGVVSKAGSFKVGQLIEGTGIRPGTKITSVNGSTLEMSAPATISGAVKFAAQGILGAPTNSLGASPSPGGHNLYSWNEGAAVFIGTLDAEDNVGGENGGLHDWKASPVVRTVEASPDGRWLAFNSVAELTGQSNTGPCQYDGATEEYSGSVPCPQVFLFDSQNNTLTCASCNPGGSSPLGKSVLRIVGGAPGSSVQPRYLDDAGRLYFDSDDSLSSLDTNQGIEDVYKYRPASLEGCARVEGCVTLISGGRGSYDSNFLAVDPSGENVFFTTRQRLVPTDTDSAIDVYDARRGGGFQEPAPTPGCVGEACQPSSASLPAELSPASSGVQGAEATAPKKKHHSHKKKKHHSHKKKKHHSHKKKQPDDAASKNDHVKSKGSK
jgi:hypothetical protein